ncbi:MAG TPA: hypothetical protein VIO12_02945, partial [Thermoanaerobaculia bacterium]
SRVRLLQAIVWKIRAEMLLLVINGHQHLDQNSPRASAVTDVVVLAVDLDFVLKGIGRSIAGRRLFSRGGYEIFDFVLPRGRQSRRVDDATHRPSGDSAAARDNDAHR